MIAIDKNIAAVRARIECASRENLHDGNNLPNSEIISLLAVSKKQPVAAIQAAIAAGIRDFGENYLQEAESKIRELQAYSLNWHYIGAIQSNKTAAIASQFDWVHSVDRLSIAQRLSKQRPEHKSPLNICLQINIDQEATKAGILPEQLAEMIVHINQLPRLCLRGLMAIPANSEDLLVKRASFAKMHSLFIEARATLANLNANNGSACQFDTLSMGMSADLELAIAEGATLLRVGTDIFGARGS